MRRREGTAAPKPPLPNSQASAVCADYGGRLANPRTTAQNAAIKSLGYGGSSTWIGLTDRGTEGSWTWSDGSHAGATGASSWQASWSFENWQGGQPDNSQGIEDCVVLRSQNGKWNDANCDTRRRFYCEIDSCDDVRSTRPIEMEAGEVRYLELVSINNAEAASSLLSLTIDDGTDVWTTSEVNGLSAEFCELAGWRHR